MQQGESPNDEIHWKNSTSGQETSMEQFKGEGPPIDCKQIPMLLQAVAEPIFESGCKHISGETPTKTIILAGRWLAILRTRLLSITGLWNMIFLMG